LYELHPELKLGAIDARGTKLGAIDAGQQNSYQFWFEPAKDWKSVIEAFGEIDDAKVFLL